MSYRTLLVHLELGQSNASLLHVAGDLAERFDARLIGIAASQPMPMIYDDSYANMDLIRQSREQVDVEMKLVETEFRNTFEPRFDSLTWRAQKMCSSISDYIAREARSADLVVSGVASGECFDSSRRVDIGDLVLQVGRPVFIVPAAVQDLKLKQVMLAWKDTREARRAAYDALPLMKLAEQVVVVEIAAGEDLSVAQTNVENVVGWLKRHGVAANFLVSGHCRDEADRLRVIAQEQNADVIVAGAYGHSRLREWALGGVTQDLLLRVDRCSLVSH